MQDQGIGIPAAELSYVVQPFYRATTARGLPGTGVGLAGATAIVAQHGGTLTLSSVEGQGTTVRVTVPRLQGSDRAADQADTGQNACPPP